MDVVLIIAAGEGERWAGYTGVPKHLAVVNGETILGRIVRQFRDAGDVVVVGPDDDRYRHLASSYCVPPRHAGWRDAGKFLSSRSLWSDSGRTLIVYGDVYFTDQAAATIAAGAARNWTLYARVGPNRYTGCPYGECFAFEIMPSAHALFDHALDKLLAWRASGLIKRNGGWELYQILCGASPSEVRQAWLPFKRHVTVIDDLTDDVDFPRDYENLLTALEERAHD